MALPNTTVEDIAVDTTLAESKPKVDGNFEDLLANDNYLETDKTDLIGVASAGSKSGWYDEKGDVVVKGSGVNDPTWAIFRNGLYAYQFSATAMKEIWINFHINHDYKPGTKIYLHVHWSTAGTNTGVCRWGFEYSVSKGHNQEVFPASTTVYVNQAAQGTAYRHMIAEISLSDAIPSTSIEPDSVIMVRVFRDAADVADTLTDASYMIFADCHYETDRHSTKNKSPNFYT